MTIHDDGVLLDLYFQTYGPITEDVIRVDIKEIKPALAWLKGTVEVFYDNNTLLFKTKDGEARVIAREGDVGEYVIEKYKAATPTATTFIAAPTMLDLIERLGLFVEKEGHYSLSQIFINKDEAVSSDRLRLVLLGYDFGIKAFLRREMLKPLKFLLSYVDEVELSSDDDNMYTFVLGFKNDRLLFTMFTTCENNYYPDYTILKKLEFQHSFRLSKAQLLKILKKFKRAEKARFTFTGSELKIELEAEHGYVENTINIENLTNSEFRIAFNHQYLAEGLQAIKGKTLEIHAVDSEHVVLFKSSEDESFAYYLMPIKL